MQIIDQVPFAAVVQAWLKGEWKRDTSFDPIRGYIPQTLIEDEDFSNQPNNELREWLLRTMRFPILVPLPQNVTWYSATYETADVPRTFIVPSNDWGPISNNQYRPVAVLPNLNGTDPHAAKIRDIRAALPSIDRRLVLVASDITSVLTIIEGNHRAVAILADASQHGTQDPLIDKVFVGVSSDMRQYPFHIEQYILPSGLAKPGP